MSEWSHSLADRADDIYGSSDTELGDAFPCSSTAALDERRRLQEREALDLSNVDESCVKFTETPFTIAARVANTKRQRLQGSIPSTVSQSSSDTARTGPAPAVPRSKHGASTSRPRKPLAQISAGREIVHDPEVERWSGAIPSRDKTRDASSFKLASNDLVQPGVPSTILPATDLPPSETLSSSTEGTASNPIFRFSPPELSPPKQGKARSGPLSDLVISLASSDHGSPLQIPRKDAELSDGMMEMLDDRNEAIAATGEWSSTNLVSRGSSTWNPCDDAASGEPGLVFETPSWSSGILEDASRSHRRPFTPSPRDRVYEPAFQRFEPQKRPPTATRTLIVQGPPSFPASATTYAQGSDTASSELCLPQARSRAIRDFGSTPNPIDASQMRPPHRSPSVAKRYADTVSAGARSPTAFAILLSGAQAGEASVAGIVGTSTVSLASAAKAWQRLMSQTVNRFDLTEPTAKGSGFRRLQKNEIPGRRNDPGQSV
ncbi:uncharacterized protein PFL1_00981 [Pseudozyma flocculosa PF-1]|uniref:uncharacterized protein n=1 Tax=Pseudozyma flocculosa PF-1 TaxID=1277687 RepID=UPI0004560CD4|nr:uncharacterized protein PFL1_00981 [Pseudozyma flocculosa PF-1]EPQ31648.1 hypothetical protein PFL1_00981 [Pseudozyma flocculosa PF-1]